MEVDCVRSQWSKNVNSRINTQNSVQVPRPTLSECDLMLRNTHALSEKKKNKVISQRFNAKDIFLLEKTL